MLVPKTSVFSTPAYPSSSVDVSLVQAFQRVCTDDSNANCNSFFPQIWKSAVILWNDADLPVPLAFNTERDDVADQRADSIDLWSDHRRDAERSWDASCSCPATLSSLRAGRERFLAQGGARVGGQHAHAGSRATRTGSGTATSTCSPRRRA